MELRKPNPEAFAAYDKAVNECLIFLIGFGVVMSGLFSIFYFGDSAPADPVRHKNLFHGGLAVSAGSVVAGFLCLTRWRVILIFVAILAAVLGGSMLVTGLVINAIIFLLLPGLGMCLVCTKLVNAVLKYPGNS